MKIKEITLLSTENYFTRSDGECTTYSYEIFLEDGKKLLIKDLKKPIPDWAKNAIIDYGLKTPSDVEVKYFLIKNESNTSSKGVL
jgi:hypothetical protein